MESTVKLVVGLGNPGPRYADTRHNIGWLVVDELARRRGLAFGPAGGTWQAAGAAANGLVLLKPLTYMNLSGEGVAAWSEAAGVAVTGAPAPADAAAADVAEVCPEVPPAPPPGAVRPLVVCDDLALPLGAVRLRARGSSGGQNGLASIIEHLAGGEFPRLRLGIAPGGEPVPSAEWPDFVLAPFTADERDLVAETVGHAADAVECWLTEGVEGAGSRYNRKGPPAPPAD